MAFGGPNQTTTPLPVQDFTPQKSYPAFSGPINQYFNPVTYTGTAVTLLPSDVLGSLITFNNGAAIAATMPSAQMLVPQIFGAQAGLPGIAPPSSTSGSGFKFFIIASGAGTVTVAAGTGGTTNGTMTVASGQIKEFLLIVTKLGDLTSTPTYTLYSLGSSAQ